MSRDRASQHIRLSPITLVGAAIITWVSPALGSNGLPPLTPQQVEKELAMFAAQARSNPFRAGNADVVDVQARGHTLTMVLRFRRGVKAPDAAFARKLVEQHCQATALRTYVDNYGIKVLLDVIHSTGDKAYTLQIDRDACNRVAAPDEARAVASAASRPSRMPVSNTTLGQCQGYVGQTIRPQNIDDALARFSNVTPKSEYETTAQYQARRSAAVGATGPMIIGKVSEGEKQFAYDADAGLLSVSPFAFRNTFFPAWEAFSAAGSPFVSNVSTGSNVDVVIEHSDQVTGSHKATNGFGATAQVAKITRTMKAIYDRAAETYNAELFPNTIGADYKVRAVGQIRMSPAEAQVLKPHLKLAFVVVPKEPYSVSGSTRIGKTTIQNPTEVTLNFSVLIADIRCGLLTDGGDKVIGAYPTL